MNEVGNKLIITLIRSGYRRVIEVNDKGVSYLHQNYVGYGPELTSSSPLKDPHDKDLGLILKSNITKGSWGNWCYIHRILK